MKHIIFDFNGTLFFDSEFHRLAWKRILARYDMEPSDEDIRRYYLGRANEEILRRVFGADVSDEFVKKMTAEKEATYRAICLEHPDKAHLTDGAVAFLDKLKACGVPITIATGSEESNVAFYFDYFGLSRWFSRDMVVLDDGTFPGKPAPDGYLRAAAKLGVEPSACTVFEDSLSGVRAAFAAGVTEIFALASDASPETLGAMDGVVEVLPDFSGMAERVEKEFI